MEGLDLGLPPGEQGLGDVQILDVVDLVPEPAAHVDRPQGPAVDERQDLEDFLVVFVQALGPDIDVQEGEELVPAEILRQLVNVDRLVVMGQVGLDHLLLAEEAGDVVVVLQAGDRPVHPRHKPGDDGRVGRGMAEAIGDDRRLENQVAFQEEGILGLHRLAGQQKRIDVVRPGVIGVVNVGNGHAGAGSADDGPQLLGSVAGDDHGLADSLGRQGFQGMFDQALSSDLDHALGRVPGQGAQPLAHSGG